MIFVPNWGRRSPVPRGVFGYAGARAAVQMLSVEYNFTVMFIFDPNIFF
jgi:hypothetical protein